MLKVGDLVHVHGNPYRTDKTPKTAKIESETATSFKVAGKSYYKKSLEEKGGICFLVPYTTSKEAKYERLRRQKRLADVLNNTVWHKYDSETLEQVLRVIAAR